MSDFTKNNVQERTDVKAYQTVKENDAYKEASSAAAEFSTYKESADDEANRSGSINQEKKKNALSSLTTGVVTAIAAASIGITSLVNVSMNAQFKSVDYQDGKIKYTINVEDKTDKESLLLTLTKDGEAVYTKELPNTVSDGNINGTIELDDGLVESVEQINENGVSLRLTLSGDVGLSVVRDFDSYLIKIDRVESRFDSVTGACHCGEDGYYYFRMNFRDDLGSFDSFEARIEDRYGNSSECTFSDNLHDEQKIFVLNLQGSEATLILTYLANGEPQTQMIDIKI